MRVLIAFGSKRGGTAGLAGMIGDAFTDAGVEAMVSTAGDVDDLTGFDAVIVVGALYMNRWHRDARRFVRRHKDALRRLPVWLVSSGPLDDSAEEHDIPPTPQVRKIVTTIGAQGHATFGGRLESGARGFPAHAMARDNAGDWRDQTHVRRWVGSVCRHLASQRSDTNGSESRPS
ncbi:flavodoxin domain-containing protein [Mycobacterium sp. IDR2000157661]|uniref:flavodoxin domain-containing protein n=1 Tax=Mycobacterium sp. IDR2000157661 TaxID=2867005 RepID=UPI001EEC32D7|nr:flavodoxin domain-containing protein [Mycobacterium sp. IDR2000157661]ULE32866.1 flavodoxin domain-containing protein [Mycobacterium sp. IDR2000157661]